MLHIASPCHFDAKDPWDIIRPAVTSTVNILGSCVRAGNSVKRVVITSSFAAILDPSKKPPNSYTEEDWNESSPRNSKEQGNDQASLDAYRASKTLAERAAWDILMLNLQLEADVPLSQDLKERLQEYIKYAVLLMI